MDTACSKRDQCVCKEWLQCIKVDTAYVKSRHSVCVSNVEVPAACAQILAQAGVEWAVFMQRLVTAYSGHNLNLMYAKNGYSVYKECRRWLKRVPGFQARSKDLREGRWSWTLTFAQKRS